MRRILSLLAVFAVIIGFGVSDALAADRGSKDEAKAMAERAAAFVKANGTEKAFAAFNQGTDGFKDRDLYVFVYNKDGICQSIGSNPAMIGKNLLEMKDSDGKPIIREFLAVQSAGWVDYKWRNPQTQDVMPKSSYVIRVNEYVVGVGAYAGN